LLELTNLAIHKIPVRGIFDPTARGEHELFNAIESVARAHFAFGDARTSWRNALDDPSLSLEQRDEIEHAAMQVQTISDTTYFYAGMAFGLVFKSVWSTT